MSTLTATKVQGSRVGAKTLFGLAGAAGVGVLVAAYPVMGLKAIVACLSLYAILRWARGRMEVWQVAVLAPLTAYIILNYGFDNFAIGIDFPFGDLLMFSALIYVILKAPKGFLGGLLKDPIIACLFALLMMSCVHLLIDVPRFGFYAIRDSSVFFEAVFLILGLAWAQNSHNIRLFVHWMFWILLVNLVYTYTFPWNEQIQA
ncbi:MAG: hypothetical protein ACRD4Y_06695, partial [Candidatus Acidiferrales bacterium]